MESLDWWLSIGLVAIASFTRGFSGFGSAMILTPGLSLFFPPQQVVASVILLEMTAAASLLPEAIPKTRWQAVLPMAMAAVVLVPVGTLGLSLLDPTMMRRLLGGLIIVFVGLLLTGKRYQGQPHVSVNLGVGALSGFLTGLTGMGGPPIALYHLSGDESAADNRANLISFFAIIQAVTLLSLWISGLLVTVVFQRFLVLLPIYFLGLLLGRFLFKQVSETLFRKFVLIMMFAIALLALFS